MSWLLGAMQDDTIFIITLAVVLVVVIGYLVLGRDDTIRLQEEEGRLSANLQQRAAAIEPFLERFVTP